MSSQATSETPGTVPTMAGHLPRLLSPRWVSCLHTALITGFPAESLQFHQNITASTQKGKKESCLNSYPFLALLGAPPRKCAAAAAQTPFPKRKHGKGLQAAAVLASLLHSLNCECFSRSLRSSHACPSDCNRILTGTYLP